VGEENPKEQYNPTHAKPIDPVLWSEDLIARYSRRGRTPVVLIDGRLRMVAAEDIPPAA
jgi:hypothetical protein